MNNVFNMKLCKAFFTIALSMIIQLSIAQTVAEKNFQQIQETISKGKMYTLAFLKKGENYEKEDKASAEKTHMEHLLYLFSLKEKGVLPLFGPFTGAGDLRGI
jgi:hypothetical protein